MLGTGAVYIETSNFSSSYDITSQVIIKKSFIGHILNIRFLQNNLRIVGVFYRGFFAPSNSVNIEFTYGESKGRYLLARWVW